MQNDFNVTGITNVIFVPEGVYTAQRTVFSSRLYANELVYHFSGESTLLFGDESVPICAGFVRLMAEGEHGRYEILREKDSACIDIFFHTDRPLEKKLWYRQWRENKLLPDLFRQIYAVYVAHKPGYRFACLSLLYRILSELEKGENYLPEPLFAKIAPAVQYIDEHFQETSLTCDALPALCGISYSYLQRLFLRRYGLTPKQYIMQLRLNCACGLLRSGRYTVTEAAQASGFYDVYFFSRQFKKVRGISPSVYAKTAGEKEVRRSQAKTEIG